MKVVIGYLGPVNSMCTWRTRFVEALAEGLGRYAEVHLAKFPTPKGMVSGEDMSRYSEVVEKAPSDAVWLLDSFPVYPFVPEIRKKAKLVTAYCHGLIPFGFDEWVYPEAGLVELYRSIPWYDLLFTGSVGVANELTDLYGFAKGQVVGTGFPLVLSDYDSYREKALSAKSGKIVVPGRMCFEKPQAVAAKALWEFRDRVVFTTSESKESVIEHDRNQWLFAKTLVNRGYEVKFAPSKEEYLGLLAEANVVFTPSISDTFNIAIAEGALLRAIPIVPDMPPFCNLYPQECLYPPIDFATIRELVESALEGGIPPVRIERMERKFGHLGVTERMYGAIKERLK